jgi:hypothetical protein
MRTKPHRCGFALLLAVGTNCAEQRLATAPAPVATAPAPAACDVTKPNGVVAGSEQVDANSYGNHELSLGPFGLWPDGTVIFKPGGAGFITRDCGLGMKFGWQRGIRGQLTIEGRRLDGSAPPLRSAVAQGDGDIGFQPTYLVFSTPGCWEVTGHVGEATLTFVTRVVKVGDGPTWRYDPW